MFKYQKFYFPLTIISLQEETKNPLCSAFYSHANKQIADKEMKNKPEELAVAARGGSWTWLLNGYKKTKRGARKR